MAKMGATNTRVERGVGSFEYNRKGEALYYGYAKQDTRQDEEDQYDYRYVEVGPFTSREAAQKAADAKFAQLEKEGPVIRKKAVPDEAEAEEAE